MEYGNTISAFFLELSKVLNCLDHNILERKDIGGYPKEKWMSILTQRKAPNGRIYLHEKQHNL